MMPAKNILTCFLIVTLLLGGVSLGQAVRQELVDADENVVGHGILAYDEEVDQTQIQVNCRDLTSGTEYAVLLCQYSPDGYLIGCMTLGNLATNDTDVGHLHVSLEGDVSGWSVIIGVVDSAGYVTPKFYDWNLQQWPILPGPGPIIWF